MYTSAPLKYVNWRPRAKKLLLTWIIWEMICWVKWDYNLFNLNNKKKWYANYYYYYKQNEAKSTDKLRIVEKA